MADMAVTLSVDQLRELVQAAVRAEIATLNATPPKEVLDMQGVCELLDRNRHTIAKLVANEGLPAHAISDREPRFMRSEVLEWLRNRPAPLAKPEAA